MISALLATCALFLVPCEFTTQEGAMVVHEIEFDNAPTLVVQGSVQRGEPFAAIEWKEMCSAIPTDECHVGCPQWCNESPCSVAFADPGEHETTVRLDGGTNLRIGPRVVPPVECP